MLATHSAVFSDPNFLKGRMMNIPNNAHNLPQPKFECEIAGWFLYGFFRTDYVYCEDRATTQEDAIRIWFNQSEGEFSPCFVAQVPYGIDLDTGYIYRTELDQCFSLRGEPRFLDPESECNFPKGLYKRVRTLINYYKKVFPQLRLG